VERRLAAVLAADVVGYSRLMGEDEEATLAVLNTYRQVIDRLVIDYRGRVFGSAGDSVIAEFAIQLRRCAVGSKLSKSLCSRFLGRPVLGSTHVDPVTV
jgi:adenylate cyclase